MAKRILQMDSVIDSLRINSREIQLVQTTDMGYGSFDHTGPLEKVGSLRSMIVGLIAPDRVNIRLLLVGLCITLLFL